MSEHISLLKHVLKGGGISEVARLTLIVAVEVGSLLRPSSLTPFNNTHFPQNTSPICGSFGSGRSPHNGASASPCSLIGWWMEAWSGVGGESGSAVYAWVDDDECACFFKSWRIFIRRHSGIEKEHIDQGMTKRIQREINAGGG